MVRGNRGDSPSPGRGAVPLRQAIQAQSMGGKSEKIAACAFPKSDVRHSVAAILCNAGFQESKGFPKGFSAAGGIEAATFPFVASKEHQAFPKNCVDTAKQTAKNTFTHRIDASNPRVMAKAASSMISLIPSPTSGM